MVSAKLGRVATKRGFVTALTERRRGGNAQRELKEDGNKILCE